MKNYELILPNIEFRLDTIVGSKRLNFHVIFSDEVNLETIENEFLNDLHIKTPNVELRRFDRELQYQVNRNSFICGFNQWFNGKYR